MSNAGLNKQNDGFDIVCMYAAAAIKSLEVENRGKTTTFEEGTPILPTTADNHEIGLDDSKQEAYRTINGKKVKLKNYKEIKMKLAEWKKREGIEDKDKDQDVR